MAMSQKDRTQHAIGELIAYTQQQNEKKQNGRLIGVVNKMRPIQTPLILFLRLTTHSIQNI